MGRYTVPGELSDAAVTIDVVYAGPDLGRVADLTGLSVEAVIAAHTSGLWRVEYCGFAPGFAYLTGGDPRLAVPRLDTPRPEVPSGAVGLAGEYSGIYPRPSPGGWNLIGSTSAVMWDLDRDPPALLRTGMRVLFRAVRELIHAGGQAASEAAASRDGSESAGPSVTVVSPGMLCLIEDLGRPGYEDMGVSPSGAADRGAAIRANRLLGNSDGAAVLEILLGGATVSADRAVIVAVTGAAAPLTVTSPEPGDGPVMDRPFTLPAGAALRLGRPKQGLRTYLSVRGGIGVPPVLGSRSTDTLSGLGPPPVAAGTRLPIGPVPAEGSVDVGARTVIPDPGSDAAEPATGESRDEATYLDAAPGPQQYWFGAAAHALLQEQSWTVSPRSNRVGVRLQGAALQRRVDDEMRIQPLNRGAIQVPPSGEPIVFLADVPVTGGYPVIAVLTEESVDRLAQARPGGTVRIRLR